MNIFPKTEIYLLSQKPKTPVGTIGSEEITETIEVETRIYSSVEKMVATTETTAADVKTAMLPKTLDAKKHTKVKEEVWSSADTKAPTEDTVKVAGCKSITYTLYVQEIL